jgi:peptidoglycan/LPS O-acetylase OafA/YrhL
MLPVTRGDGTLKGGPLHFFKRRARRILPPYYAALLLSLFLIVTVIGKPTGTLWDVCIAIRPSDLASHFLLLQHFFGTGRINYSFWSISLEWQIYFFFPLLVVAFRRIGAPITTTVALAAGYAITLLVGPEHERIHRANLHYMGLFTLGMAAACVAFGRGETVRRLRERAPWAISAAVLVLLQVGLMKYWGWTSAIDHWPLLDLLSAAAAAFMLVAAVLPGTNPVRRIFELRPLVSIGRYSFSLYLVHAPLMQLFWQYLLKPLGISGVPAFAALAIVGTPLILLLARVFYRLVEEPFTSARAATPVAAAPPAAS